MTRPTIRSTAYNAATMMVAAAAPKTTETATVGADRDHLSNEDVISLHTRWRSDREARTLKTLVIVSTNLPLCQSHLTVGRVE